MGRCQCRRSFSVPGFTSKEPEHEGRSESQWERRIVHPKAEIVHLWHQKETETRKFFVDNLMKLIKYEKNMDFIDID
jgi:GH18 family chitinase